MLILMHWWDNNSVSTAPSAVWKYITYEVFLRMKINRLHFYNILMLVEVTVPNIKTLFVHCRKVALRTSCLFPQDLIIDILVFLQDVRELHLSEWLSVYHQGILAFLQKE